ncbi:Protein IRREGULAR XYLEM 15 [Acorus calamus]|uniref:Protein IRREGULAR XYLEM 15 n=1 Tax=Acorus calamus TaxID=4465 RepID=A0AAV9FC62_ACOCL|nr:Protein IRREGULAR XYLEM 15 [Acorus calamus]
MKTNTTTTTNTPTTNTKLIFFHHSIPTKQNPGGLFLLAFLSLSALAFLLTLYSSLSHPTHTIPTTHTSSPTTTQTSSLPRETSDALLYYYSFSNQTNRMSDPDARAVARAITSCSPCSVLVFGLGHETPLWRALNPRGRTVFIDESDYFVSRYEGRHANLEAYEVQYATTVREFKELVRTAKAQAGSECRPVQNLLFSDCRLGINDMPNQLYEVDWDVILVDGPRGYYPSAPGRMSAIFTAGVLARSKRGGSERTHVFVHDFEREVERVCGEEFLCKENLVESTWTLAHYVVERVGDRSGSSEFCPGKTVGNQVQQQRRRR